MAEPQDYDRVDEPQDYDRVDEHNMPEAVAGAPWGPYDRLGEASRDSVAEC